MTCDGDKAQCPFIPLTRYYMAPCMYANALSEHLQSLPGSPIKWVVEKLLFVRKIKRLKI